MKKTETIFTRQLIAILFLTVFGFVHSIKFFHHHDTNSINHCALTAEEEIKKSADCAVCDYHFTKDSNCETACISIALQKSHTSNVGFHLSRFTSSVGLSSADRGPPALL